MHKIIYAIVAIVFAILIIGSSVEDKAHPNPNRYPLSHYDRSNPNHPMHGIYTPDICDPEVPTQTNCVSR